MNTHASGIVFKSEGSMLAMRPRHMAEALGIGQRKLWELSQPRGPIPCVRVGTCVLYPVEQVRAWLAEQATQEGEA